MAPRYENLFSCYHQDAADAAQSAMVSIIGLDSDKVQALCDAANEDVDEANKVQIANFLCTVSSNFRISLSQHSSPNNQK